MHLLALPLANVLAFTALWRPHDAFSIKPRLNRHPTTRLAFSLSSSETEGRPVLAPVNNDKDPDVDDDDDAADSWNSFFTSTATSANTGLRDADLEQARDLDLILTERAERFYDPKLVGVEKEKCILVAVDTKLEERRADAGNGPVFSLRESLSELSELVGTAGLQVMASCVQRRYTPHTRTYIGPGKVHDVMAAVNATDARTLVIDDDLSTRQQVAIRIAAREGNRPAATHLTPPYCYAQVHTRCRWWM